jgi:hypothetical protein
MVVLKPLYKIAKVGIY